MRRRVIALTLTFVALAAASARGGKPLPPQPPADPAIAFTTSQYGGDLVVVNADGTNRTTLVSGARRGPTPGAYAVDPDWSPDGTTLVFAGNVGAGPGIYVVNRDGTGLRKVVATTVTTFVSPVWSPAPVPGVGGSRPRIAYTDTGVGGEPDVWIVDLDGSNPVNVSNTPDPEYFPAWSPSGTKLACQRFLGGTGAPVRDAYGLVDFAAGGTFTTVTYGGALTGHYVRRPSWAKAHEERMAVEARVDWPALASGPFDVWLVDPLDPAAAPVNRTSTAAVSETSPSFSPDDSALVFSGDGIQVMNADGTGRRQIATSGYQPVWRRNP